MAPLVHTDPGARIAFYCVLGLFGLLELRTSLRSGLSRGGTRADSGTRLLVGACVGGGLGAAIALAERSQGAAISFARWPLFGAGLALMLAGIALRQWAVALLGRFFTTDVRIHPGQAVIDAGPYRWVRHPSYSGLLLTVAGVGLTLANWLSLAVVAVVPLAGIAARIRVEERVLLAGLGEPYRRFAATRARLVPGVW